MDLKLFSEIAYSFAIIGSIIAAGWWFISTAKSKQRIQFDIDVSFLKVENRNDQFLAEIKCIFENKGYVEYKIYDLALAIYGIEKGTKNSFNGKEDDAHIFPIVVLDKTSIVPKEPGYYFVRPGVVQKITEIRLIPRNISAIKVLAGFTYIKRMGKKTERGAFEKPYIKNNHPHTALRVFEIPDRFNANKV